MIKESSFISLEEMIKIKQKNMEEIHNVIQETQGDEKGVVRDSPIP